MKEKVIIFGLNDFAELAHFYLTTDSPFEVVAFCVNKDYLPEQTTFKDLPIIAFEGIETIYPVDKFKFFAPLAPTKMSKNRTRIYLEIKEKGYTLVSYISSRATVLTNQIGENCFILEDNTIQPFTKIGNNVVLWSGNHIGHHSEIKDHVFFTSHVVMSGHCIIEPYCFFGVNATIRDYSHLKQGTLLAMGASLVRQDTDEWGVYVGNPAKKIEGKISTEVY